MQAGGVNPLDADRRGTPRERLAFTTNNLLLVRTIVRIYKVSALSADLPWTLSCPALTPLLSGFKLLLVTGGHIGLMSILDTHLASTS